MLILPAIDLMNGACVRLLHGDYDKSTTYSSDPVAMASHWASLGISRLHIVDLDAAKAGTPVHTREIRGILAEISNIEVQLGGGIRDLATVEQWLEAGVTYPIIGTAAIVDRDFIEAACAKWPNQLIVSLDTKDDSIALSGWTEMSALKLDTVAKSLADLPLQALIHTDISKDGALTGPSIVRASQLAQLQPHDVIVAGGVATASDIDAIADTKLLAGAICGRAIYENTLDLPAVLNKYRQ